MKLMIVFVGVLTVLGGLLPFIASYLPNPLNTIPTSGPVYQGIIVVIGLIAIIYGLKRNSLSGL